MTKNDSTIFNNPVLVRIIMAILIKNLGGSVDITQQDIDEVAYNILDETQNVDGSITLSYKIKSRN